MERRNCTNLDGEDVFAHTFFTVDKFTYLHNYMYVSLVFESSSPVLGLRAECTGTLHSLTYLYTFLNRVLFYKPIFDYIHLLNNAILDFHETDG